MLSLFFKKPIDKLNDQYCDLLKKAVDAQRNGKIELYANLSAKAQEVLREIEKIENQVLNSKSKD